MHMAKMILFFDLDDTLIENAKYFDTVKNNVAEECRKKGIEKSINELKLYFDEIENKNHKKYGKGKDNFRRSLKEACRTFANISVGTLIDEQVDWLESNLFTPIYGVGETLEALSEYFPILCVTHGNPQEQINKIERSHLSRFFNFKDKSLVILENKSREQYSNLLESLTYDPEYAVMVGNSPKKDINPAKEAGMITVFIPSKHTWHMDDEDISGGDPPTLVAFSITDLKDLFMPSFNLNKGNRCISYNSTEKKIRYKDTSGRDSTFIIQ